MVMNNKAMEPNANHVVNSVNLNNNEDKNANRDFNPTVLGREFVRQYYTMLNEGPQNLFRFYSDNSSLIHGNEPNETVTPAYGQHDINKKLMSLNFKDCHTKIRQVDSLETVNKSVVVQVIGELSNNGQPMRRFFQTFILAPRSPTHYYVRNDIFRYQDEVFFDDEGYTEENLDDGNHVIDSIDTTDVQASILNSSLVVNSNNNTITGSAIQQTKTDKLNGQFNEQQDNNKSSSSEEKSNKFSCPEISPINAVSTNQTTNDLQEQLNNSGSEPSIDSPTTLNNNNNIDKPAEDDEKANDDEKNNATTDQPVALVQSANEEKLVSTTTTATTAAPIPEHQTYATMVQRKFGQLSTGGSPSTVISLDKREKDGQLIKSNEESLVHTVLNNKKEKEHLSSDWTFESNNETPTATFTTTNHHQESKSQRNGSGHPSDEQQVFVGNLPSTIDENQLREFFIEYGEIIDVRICQKQGKTPNYGFITFNDAPVVKKILSKKPIFFNGHRINVEEKKSTGRSFNSSSSGSFNRNKDKDKDHPSNRNFNSSTGSSNQFSAFSNSTRVKEDRNRGFKDKDRKSTNISSSGNRNTNSNFRR